MREKYEGSHKYDSAMTAYLDAEVLGVSGEDESVSNEPDGGWCARIGKRIVFGDSNGFVSSDKFESVGEAEVEFAGIAASDYFAEDEEA